MHSSIELDPLTCALLWPGQTRRTHPTVIYNTGGTSNSILPFLAIYCVLHHLRLSAAPVALQEALLWKMQMMMIARKVSRSLARKLKAFTFIDCRSITGLHRLGWLLHDLV